MGLPKIPSLLGMIAQWSLPPPDQIPRVFVGHSFDKMSPPARKDRSDREPCKRLYFFPHKSVLSRPSDRIEADIVVYCQ